MVELARIHQLNEEYTLPNLEFAHTVMRCALTASPDISLDVRYSSTETFVGAVYASQIFLPKKHLSECLRLRFII